MQQKTQQSTTSKAPRDLMQRNVTQFRHLLAKSYVTQSDLNWTMNLRDGSVPKNVQHKQPSAPEVFFKKTMLSTIRDEMNQQEKSQKKTINVGQYGHMMPKKLQRTPSKQTLQQLKFYNDLRKDKKIPKNGVTQSSKQFDIYLPQQRQKFPSFIKKQYLHKINVRKNEVESAFDGAQNQQPYTNKMKTKNYAVFQPMTRIRGRNRVELPTLAWEMGLRSY